MNKKSHALALKSALSIKAKENNILVVKEFTTQKTKEFVKVMENLKLDSKTLIVLDEEKLEFMLSARNVQGVKVVLANNVCVYDLMNAEKLVFTPEAVKALEGGLK